MENRLKPFTCHFCNKTISNETEFGHISVCGSVLVPCPHKCGSYVTRVDLHQHKKECINRVQASRPTRLPSNDYNNMHYDANVSNISSLGRRSDGSNQTSDHSLPQTRKEIALFNKRLSTLEKKFEERYSVMLKRLDDIATAHLRQNQVLFKIKNDSQVTTEWRKAIDLHLDAIKQSLSSFEVYKAEKNIRWRKLDQQIEALESTQKDLEMYKKQFLKERDNNKDAILELAREIDALRNTFGQENAATVSLWNEQKSLLDYLDKELVNMSKTIDEQKAKYTNTVFDLKTVTQISSESSEKIEILERKLKKLEVETEHTKLDVESLEDLASGGYNNTLSSSTTGHIMWRISDFEEKLSKAKEFNNVLKSPIFFTHDFGYRIRVLVYLNGLKKWKDRHTLISIHVLKGEFDALLKWPCCIEGSLTLRDLDDLENPKHFTKYISAKRQAGDEETEDPQESSTSYIFIPHSTLIKSRYLKNDTVYLEVRIKQNSRSTETVL